MNYHARARIPRPRHASLAMTTEGRKAKPAGTCGSWSLRRHWPRTSPRRQTRCVCGKSRSAIRHVRGSGRHRINTHRTTLVVPDLGACIQIEATLLACFEYEVDISAAGEHIATLFQACVYALEELCFLWHAPNEPCGMQHRFECRGVVRGRHGYKRGND